MSAIHQDLFAQLFNAHIQNVTVANCGGAPIFRFLYSTLYGTVKYRKRELHKNTIFQGNQVDFVFFMEAFFGIIASVCIGT